MRIIAVIILIFGVALAGGAVFFASEQFQKLEAALARQIAEQQPAAPQIETTDIVVASRVLKQGELLVADDVKIVKFPAETAPENAFSTLDEAIGDGEKPRMVRRSIEKNEPILLSKVTDFGERPTVADGLAPGMRAVTLPVDTVSGVAGFLLPGDRVDVFLTRGAGDTLTTELILQNVKVIAVDQFSEQEAFQARVARTVTFEVSLADAQRLALANRLGSISLSLRQSGEETMVEEVGPVGVKDVVTVEEEAEPAPPEAKGPCVRKGTELVCE